MPVRTIFDFTMSGTGPKTYGWTEVYIYTGTAPTLQSIIAPVENLARARVQLLGSNGELKSVRLSDESILRDSLILLTTGQGGGHTTGVPAVSDWNLTCDIPNTAVLCRLLSSPAKRRNLYLAGIPDTIIATSPAGPELAVASAIQRFNVFSAELTGAPMNVVGLGNNWGYRGRKTAGIVNTPILRWGLEPAGGTNLVAYVSSAEPSLVAGAKVQVSNVLMRPRGLPKPIGIWYIQEPLVPAGGQQGYILSGTEGFDPASIDVKGKLIQVDFDYFPFTQFSLAGQVTRKRGVGSVRPRGRLSRRRQLTA